MNIRLSRNHIRFRISREELDRLKEGSVVEELTCFPGRMALRYRVAACPDNDLPVKRYLALAFRDNRLSLSVAESALRKLHASLPSKEGIEGEETEPLGMKLRYSLEVDLHG